MIDEKTILITGGTGSFGRKFVEVVLKKYKPKRIIVISRDELKQHEMRLQFDDSRLGFFVGDVRDRDRLHRAFEANVDIVVHAAALKQVPSCEYNPFEAIKTNVIGAQNVIDAAIDCGIKKVIALSTDKAVNPINLYGATKLCAGKITRFSCARYGNVVGSRGSVIPVFLAQRQNGKVSVTDRRMTRFWITLEQGVEFVITCISLMRGGEVFVPRIPSMGIMDLVKAIAPDCETEFTGIRPGEKLHETLISHDEARHTIATKEMFIILPEFTWWEHNNWVQGDRLVDGFTFTSDKNNRWLAVEELRQMVEAL
jgi:UDP-N-acetylglucosamine 4,6-dehydratase